MFKMSRNRLEKRINQSGELAEMNERVDAEKTASVEEEIKQNEQTLKIIIATINANDSDSKIDRMSSEPILKVKLARLNLPINRR